MAKSYDYRHENVIRGKLAKIKRVALFSGRASSSGLTRDALNALPNGSRVTKGRGHDADTYVKQASSFYGRTTSEWVTERQPAMSVGVGSLEGKARLASAKRSSPAVVATPTRARRTDPRLSVRDARTGKVGKNITPKRDYGRKGSQTALLFNGGKGTGRRMTVSKTGRIGSGR
jgi:hypothetical protein